MEDLAICHSIRLLPSIVIAKACHTHESNESKAIAVLTNYGCLLPELVGRLSSFPALATWQSFGKDPSPDVQVLLAACFYLCSANWDPLANVNLLTSG
ncbi:hypothetical protein DSO57_1039310 [Entomophthora muscae]|uniref:Uncharacterized protein n=1 Tax=Entomophthora muscae TaxID=34485 RepID=A0ACC2RPC4_9FUNG|nr:hypothetical protein DSO57_1039310 [Entomophthora muscae]